MIIRFISELTGGNSSSPFIVEKKRMRLGRVTIHISRLPSVIFKEIEDFRQPSVIQPTL